MRKLRALHRRLGASLAYGTSILLAFVFVIAMAVIPALGATPWARGGVTQPEETIPTLLHTWPDGERRLPLVSPGGRLDQSFPDGVPWQHWFDGEEPEVAQVVQQMVADSGLTSIGARLLERDPRPYVENTSWREGEPTHLWTYPYSYPSLQVLLSGAVDENLRFEREAELVDLSSALLFTDRAPAAFALLQRMRSLGNSCEVQVNLAQAVSLGYRPDIGIVDNEFAEAELLCTDDPIAYVAHSRAVLALETRGDDSILGFKVGDVGQEDKAVALARKAQQSFPSHTAGYLAEATIQLEIATEYAMINHQPFTTRAMFRRARELLLAALPLHAADPTVQFALARAEAGLRNHGAAVRIGRQFLGAFTPEAEGDEKAASAVTQWALDAGDAEAAALGLDAQRRPEFGGSHCRSLTNAGFNGAQAAAGLPEPGWRANCNVQLMDATGGELPGGADIASYTNFIPHHRLDQPDTDMITVLAGRDSEGWVAPARPGGYDPEQPHFGRGERFLAALNGQWPGPPGDLPLRNRDVEVFQDALRRIGRLDQAESLLRSAAEEDADVPLLTYDRLGEVLFLQGKFEQAADAFASAAERGAGQATPSRPFPDYWDRDSLSVEWARIKQATALDAAGRTKEAREVLTKLTFPTAYDNGWPPSNYYDDQRPRLQELARSFQLGLIAMKHAQFQEAATWFERALAQCEAWSDTALNPCRSGAQENNLATALMKAGQHERAIELAQRAIGRDPKNPMFVEGLANALEAKGDAEAAAAVYRQATEQDPTQFTAQNNLGVILARQGDLAGAIGRFRQAVAGNPDYPAGWHNLGVAWAATGHFGDSVRSQGALGRAATLDPAFRDADADWVTDTTVYDPGLDLSKPLPKDWAAGTNRKPLPVAFAIPLLLASALHVVRALVSENLYGRLTEWALGWTRRRPFSSLVVPRWGELVAVLVCALVLGAGMGSTLGWTPWVTAAGFLASLLTVWSYVTTRKLLSSGLTHHASVGGTIVGVLGAPFGVSFAPVPVVEGQVRPWVRWAPLAVTAALAVIAMGLTMTTGVPVVRAVAQAALLVVGSSLIPIEPFEGTKVPRALSLPLAITLAVPTVAFSALWL